MRVTAEVSAVLGRRAAMDKAPASVVVSDAVALGIAANFRSSTTSGRVMDCFYRTGTADSDELIVAARFEQDFATPEQHVALYCLILWAHSRAQRQTRNS
jgi:hypothetical protein